MIDEQYVAFVREHFRDLKVKNANRIRMGRVTYDWILQQENKDRLDHLTIERLEELAAKYALKKVIFDDGNMYIVRPEVEREILVAFFKNKETLEPRLLRARIKGDAPVADEDLTDRYLVSFGAVQLLAGADAMKRIEEGESVGFLSNLDIEKALDAGQLRLAYDEGKILVMTFDEEPEDTAIYPLVLKSPLAGTEVSVEELDLSQQTILTGDYRDTVGEASHTFEHLVTKSED